MADLWVSGIANDDGSWSYVGVYATKRRALITCRSDNSFVAPIKRNEERPKLVSNWDGLEYGKYNG
ncbi:hypothetical protein N9895_02055 [Gammaproteobacteria bacterium]|nr:hypothetical protein [Gammaproteobacteria bacterium]